MIAEGYKALFHTEAKHRCRAFFSEEFQCNTSDNKLCEPFHCKIVEVICKSIINIFEDKRVIIMTKLQR